MGLKNNRPIVLKSLSKRPQNFYAKVIHVFAPVIYVNQIVEKLGLSSLENRRNIVMPYLLDFLQASKGLVLITVDGWQNSWEVRRELEFCQKNQIPIYKINSNQIYDNLTKILSYPLDQKQVHQLLEGV